MDKGDMLSFSFHFLFFLLLYPNIYCRANKNSLQLDSCRLFLF